MRSKENITKSVTSLAIIGVIFIILKLTNLINWDWYAVLLPLYFIPVILGLLILIIGIVYLMTKID